MIIYIIIIIIFILILIKKYVNGAYCNINKNIKGQNIIITGCNQGIGKETALRLAKQGGHIILACRSIEKTQPLIDEITKKYGKEKVHFQKLDLNDLEQIKQFSEIIHKKYEKIDTLINNAGVLYLLDPKKYITKQGYESSWGVNYLGHFYLTHLLFDLIKNSNEGRIINVSSDYHSKTKGFKNSGMINFEDINWDKYYNGFSAYSQSKLGNILHARYLSFRCQQKNLKIKAMSLHPGCVDTSISKNIGNDNIVLKFFYKIFKPMFAKIVLKSMEHGSQTSVQLALQNFQSLEAGGYYEECKLSKSSVESYDKDLQQKLWNYTHQQLEIQPII